MTNPSNVIPTKEESLQHARDSSLRKSCALNDKPLQCHSDEGGISSARERFFAPQKLRSE